MQSKKVKGPKATNHSLVVENEKNNGGLLNMAHVHVF